MTRLRDLTLGVLAAATVVALSAGEGAAQQRRGPPAGRPQERAQLEQRVRARFAEVIRERLGLTEAQARALSEATGSFMEERRQLFQEEQSLRRRRDAVLIDPNPSDEEATSLLRRMGELRAAEARLFQAEQEALLEILGPVRLVRFHALREQLSQRIQQLRGEGGPPRPPGGGAPWVPIPLPPG